MHSPFDGEFPEHRSIPVRSPRAPKALLIFSQGYPIDVFRVMDYRGGVLSLQDEDLHKAVTPPREATWPSIRSIPAASPLTEASARAKPALTADATERQAASLAAMEARQRLRALAQATGGFAVVNTNSFESAWDRIVRENSSYYLLGFSSSNERRDGRYRRLQVRVKRPGLLVRGRDGYVAPLRNERPAPAPPPPANMSAALAAALGTPIAVSGLPIRVFAAPYKGTGTAGHSGDRRRSRCLEAQSRRAGRVARRRARDELTSRPIRATGSIQGRRSPPSFR